MPISNHIQIELTASRSVFVIDGVDTVKLINKINFRSLDVRNFSKITIYPKTLQVANPEKFEFDSGRYPDSAWEPIKSKIPITINNSDDNHFSFESLNSSLGKMGTLNGISVKPDTKIIFELDADQSKELYTLTMKLECKEFFYTSVNFYAPFYFTVNGVNKIDGIPTLPYQSHSLTFKTTLQEDYGSLCEIAGQSNTLELYLSIPSDQIESVFPRNKAGFWVKKLNFFLYDGKKRATSLVAEGVIRYPDLPKIQEKKLFQDEVIGLRDFDKFSIRKIAIDLKNQGFRFLLDGKAAYVKKGTSDFQKDLRIKRFETYSFPVAGRILSLLLAVVGPSIAQFVTDLLKRKYLKEDKK